MKKSFTPWVSTLIGIALFCLVAYLFSHILIYLIIAAVIGFIGDPVMQLLEKIHVRKWYLPSWLNAIITLSFFVGLFLGIFWLMAPIITQEISLLRSMNVDQMTHLFHERLGRLSGWIDSLNLNFNADALYKLIVDQGKDLMNFQWVTVFFRSIFNFMAATAAAVLSILFMSFFFLRDRTLFSKIIFVFTPERHMDKMKNIVAKSHRMLVKYFSGLLIQVMIMCAMISLGMFFFGVKNALLIGLLAGLLNVIPYVGPLVAVLLGLLIGITSGLAHDPDLALLSISIKIVSVFGVAMFIDNWFVQPLVIGNSIHVHPFEFFIILLAAGHIGGIVGLIVALPVYAILRIVAKEFFEQFKIVETLTKGRDE